MVDGNLTVLTIADPKKPHMKEYLMALPSRNPEGGEGMATTTTKTTPKKEPKEEQSKPEE